MSRTHTNPNRLFPLPMLGLSLVIALTGSSAMAQTEPPPDGGEGARQPIIIPNQFDTTSGGALAARRPGLLTQQAIAFNQGAGNALSGEIPENNTFVENTSIMVAEGLLEIIRGLLDMIPQLINLLLGVNSGLGGLTGALSNFIPIPSAITGGQGASVPIQ